MENVESTEKQAELKVPQTLMECIRYFSDPDVCVEFVAAMKWMHLGGKPMCPYCKGADKGVHHSYLKTRRIWKCRVCKKQFSVKAGTIFEDSPIPLDKWLMAVWLVVNCKNGVSSYEIARDLKVTQKTAWFMRGRIRLAMQEPDRGTKLGSNDGGEVEVDETFVGGKVQNMHKSRRLKIQQIRSNVVQSEYPSRYPGKTVVQGILDREARQVRATVLPNVKRETLQAEVLNNVKYGSRVYTDDAVAYDKLHWRYVHDVVSHVDTYVKGRVHTNGLENFWCLLKRGLKETYVAVEPFHLSRYVDEQVFRYNNRATKDNPLNDADRFVLALSQIAGRRLTYKELTGKVGETTF
jgi:transposase-like protein